MSLASLIKLFLFKNDVHFNRFHDSGMQNDLVL